MIQTYWTLRAFDAFAKLFQRLGTVIVQWDVKRQRIYITTNLMKLFPFFVQLLIINSMCIFMILYVGIHTILFYNQKGSPDISSSENYSYPPEAFGLLYVVLGVLQPPLYFAYFVFYILGDGLVETVNALLHETTTKRPKPQSKQELIVLIREDILGFGIYCSVYFLFFVVIAIVIGVFVKVDPWYYFINWALRSTELSEEAISIIELFCIPVRMTFSFVTGREGARIFPMTLAVIHLLMQSLQDTLGILQDSDSLIFVPSRINYSHIILAPAMPIFDIFNSLLLGGGLQILVVANYVTLRLFNVLPFAVYLTGPVVTIFILFFIHVGLPKAANVNDKSIQSLLKARQIGNNNKYIAKYAKATRPLAFRAGTGNLLFFELSHDFMTGYYESIAKSTTDALVAFR